MKFPVTGRHFSSKILSSRIIKLGICNFPFISVLNHFYIFFRSFCLISPPRQHDTHHRSCGADFSKKRKECIKRLDPTLPIFPVLLKTGSSARCVTLDNGIDLGHCVARCRGQPWAVAGAWLAALRSGGRSGTPGCARSPPPADGPRTPWPRQLGFDTPTKQNRHKSQQA